MAAALEMRRIILFTDSMDTMSRFYGEVLGLEQAGSETGWRDSRPAPAISRCTRDDRNPARDRPNSSSMPATSPPSVPCSSSAAWKMGKVLSTATFDMCNGTDPDGNPFQISARK